MVIRGYCIEIVFKFYFREIFVYKITIRIISKIYPGLWIIQTPPPPLTGPLSSLPASCVILQFHVMFVDSGRSGRHSRAFSYQ